MKVYFAFRKVKTKNLFNLDSPPTKTDIKDRWRSIKVIVGSAVGCITALVFFILIILYLRRRCKRLEPEVKDEVVGPR